MSDNDHNESENLDPDQSAVKVSKSKLKIILGKLSPLLKNKKILLLIAALVCMGASIWITSRILHKDEATLTSGEGLGNGEAKSGGHNSEAIGHNKASSKNEDKVDHIELGPDNTDLQIELMETLVERGLYLRAAKHADELLSNSVKNPELAKLTGRALLGAGLSAKAIAFFELAQRANPNDIENQALLLAAKIRSGQNTQAISQLNTLANEHKNDLSITLPWTEAMLSLGQNKELLAVSNNFGNDPKFLEKVAKAKFNLGGCSNSISDLNHLTDQYPQLQQAWALKAYCLHQAKDINGALKAYHWALGLNEEDYNTWFNLGELHYSIANASSESAEVREHNRESLEALLECVKYKPDHPEAHFRIGTLMLYNKQYHEAIQHFEIAKEANDRKLKCDINISLAWKQLGSETDSKRYLDSARAIAPKDAEVWQQILADQGKD